MVICEAVLVGTENLGWKPQALDHNVDKWLDKWVFSAQWNTGWLRTGPKGGIWDGAKTCIPGFSRQCLHNKYTNTRKGQPRGNTTVVQPGKRGCLHTPPTPHRPAPCPTAQTHALPMGEDLMSGAGNAHNVSVRFKSRLKTACSVCSQC